MAANQQQQMGNNPVFQTQQPTQNPVQNTVQQGMVPNTTGQQVSPNQQVPNQQGGMSPFQFYVVPDEQSGNLTPQQPVQQPQQVQQYQQTTQQPQGQPFQQVQQPSQPTQERPAWLPDNFKSGEDLLRSYHELQAKNTQTSNNGLNCNNWLIYFNNSNLLQIQSNRRFKMRC